MKKRRYCTKEGVSFLVIGILIMTQIPYAGSAPDLNSLSTVVRMQERNLTVIVYYYEGEEEWGQHIFDTTVEALPILEDLAGFPYPHDFDVVIYPKRSNETSMWNAQNLLYQGIWFNRDRFTPENITSWSITAVIIHENVHYWSNSAIYEIPWLKEGFCELFAYLTLERMGREKEALHRKGDWLKDFEKNRYYNIPLDMFEYEAVGPGNETTLLAYSKSALFCYEIYEKYGLDEIQRINRFLHRNNTAADSFMYMNLLEEYTGEDQKELFTEWVFPKRIDLEAWQNAEDKISELELLVDSSLSRIEEKYGFHKFIDFIEFQIHIDTQINTAESYIEEYDIEKALQIVNGEIEDVNEIMNEFDAYVLRYFEAEEYYNSLNLGEIPKDKLLAARDRLLSFEYDLFTEQLAEFYEEMEKLETYQVLYKEWCTEGCTSMKSLGELLSHDNYEEVILYVDRTVTAISEYNVTGKELKNSDWFTELGIILMRKEVDDFELDLKHAEKEIKNGNIENALGILAHIREELSKARMYGVGLVLGVLGFVSFLVVRQKKKRDISKL